MLKREQIEVVKPRTKKTRNIHTIVCDGEVLGTIIRRRVRIGDRWPLRYGYKTVTMPWAQGAYDSLEEAVSAFLETHNRLSFRPEVSYAG